MSKLLENYPVLVEWYTYERIPRTKHVIVTTSMEARKWVRHGAAVEIVPIDSQLYREFKNEGGHQ